MASKVYQLYVNFPTYGLFKYIKMKTYQHIKLKKTFMVHIQRELRKRNKCFSDKKPVVSSPYTAGCSFLDPHLERSLSHLTQLIKRQDVGLLSNKN